MNTASTSGKRHCVVALIPAYQPNEALLTITAQLLQAGTTVVVVDDGSGSDYQTIFAALDERVHVVTHRQNRGKGAALKTGYRYIDSNFSDYTIVTADADGQHSAADIEKVAAASRHHPQALLLGSRTFTQKNVPFRSKFGNQLTKEIFALVTHHAIRDTQTGLRAFGNELVEFMLSVDGERFEYEMEVLLSCRRHGIPIVELPIETIYEKGNPTSHFDPIKDSASIYGQILKFVSASLLSFGLDYLLFLVLLQLTSAWTAAASVITANIVARIISATFNFVANKRVVFRHKGRMAKSIASYAALAVTILAANTVILYLMTSFLHVQPYLAKIVIELSLFVVSYVVQRKIIFRHT